MSDTPRTDELQFHVNVADSIGRVYDMLVVNGNDCRTIERELVAAQATIATAHNAADLIAKERDAFESALNDSRAALAKFEQAKLPEPVFVIFDGPPSHESGRFVEVENAQGKSVSAGEWIPNGDTVYWQLGPFYTRELRAFAAAQSVRAEGNERDAEQWRNFMKQVDVVREKGYTGISLNVTTSGDAAIKGQE